MSANGVAGDETFFVDLKSKDKFICHQEQNKRW